MTISGPEDLEGLRHIGRIVAQTLSEMKEAAKPGMTTKELDDIGKACLERLGARSAPILMYNFPGATCISINEEVAHGIPSKRVIQAGDLVNVDVSAECNGYFADTGASFVMPDASAEKVRLCKFGQKALSAALSAAKAGSPLRDLGKAVEKVAKEGGYEIIRNLGGHGVGRSLHEEPSFISNYNARGERRSFKEGQVVAIEPFLSKNIRSAKESFDGWTLKGAPGTYAVQYEHTVVITKDEPIILTTL